MDLLDAYKRLEYAFSDWLLKYKKEEWRNLTPDELICLNDMHFETFILSLKKITKGSDYPFEEKKDEILEVKE